jgi:TDG/mug DNA glycosylase family protein
VDRRTVDLYEAHAARYEELRPPRHRERAKEFATTVPAGALRADLGCGPGIYASDLGEPLVCLDAAIAMVEAARRRSPEALAVCADLECLPFRRRSLAGAWSRMAYQHLEPERLPLALAHLHWALDMDAQVFLQLDRGEGTPLRTDDTDDIAAGRLFAQWREEDLVKVLAGAGFEVEEVETYGDGMTVRARRLLSLPDVVGPGMRMLVSGLNPAVYAAERGIGFARPGNRFWPAMVAAGLAAAERDPVALLRDHGIGMTDIVKRATPRASDLDPSEYREGWSRLEHLVSWLQPEKVLFVGLDGWRRVVDRKAQPGWQGVDIGGAPAYLMPSTSGLNAHSRLEDFVTHLRLAASGPG